MDKSKHTLVYSFKNAFKGIKFFILENRNVYIELSIGLLVIVFGFIFHITTTEWVICLLCISSVLCTEAINTSIEIFADKLHPAKDSMIGKVKDIAAGAVLIASIFATINGFIIFAPYLLKLFSSLSN